MGRLDQPIDWAQLPQAGARRVALRVTDAAETVIRQGHPWLFDGAITRASHAGQPGDLAVIFDRKGRFLAVGLYDPDSPIRVKILQANTSVTIDRDWLTGVVAAALARRLGVVSAETTGYRLINGENDGLPGVVLDRYGDTAVLKLYTAAWLPHLADLTAAVGAAQGGAHGPLARLVLRLSRRVQAATRTVSDGRLIWGDPPPPHVLFRENGLTFAADVRHGQKTGWFLDQRDNRSRVEQLSAGRSVLDVFACTGGFAVYAARGGATAVLSIDSSAPALAAARHNMALNRHLPPVAAAAYTTLTADAFTALADLASDRRQFDVVVLDPPAFAQRRHAVPQALAAYERLTTLGVRVLAPGGMLVAASCSSRVSAETFFATVQRAAAAGGRPLHAPTVTGHAADHPVTFPEGAYLKCLFGRA